MERERTAHALTAHALTHEERESNDRIHGEGDQHAHAHRWGRAE